MQDIGNLQWFALRSPRPFETSEKLGARCAETYVPVERAKRADGKERLRPAIPKLVFIRATAEDAAEIEAESRAGMADFPPIWIYRYERGGEIQPIRDREMRLFMLLTADDSERCEIYRKPEFKIGDRLRVTGGPFAGYEGWARRIRKNKHIVVEIEGVCAIALPYIHPDLLEKIN